MAELIKNLGELFKNPTISGLFGILLGSVLTATLAFANAWLMKRRELDLKLWERFLDRRITAHETIVSLALKMRVMCPLGGVDCHEVIRAPLVMMSKKEFDSWLQEFATQSMSATTWLSTDATRELNFVQDYLITVHTKLFEATSEQFRIVGAFVKQDFIDLSDKLEKTAFAFFGEEARELRLSDLTKHHKYPLEYSKSRMEKTVLLSRWSEVRAVLQSGDDDSA